MNNKPTKWNWSDGWILMAIHMMQSDMGASLSEIVAAADATNHAIPTTKELSEALTKFAQHSLIQISENRYSIREPFRSSIAEAYRARGGLFATTDKGLKWLKKANLAQDNGNSILVSENELGKAYKQYIDRMKKK